MGKGEAYRIVEEELEKFKNTGVTKGGIARYLVNKYPLHFRTEDNANWMIRHHTGATGRQKPDIVFNLGQLPESHAEPYIPYKVSLKRPLILSDIHCPYQDNIALEAAINYGIRERADGVILNGDTLDMYHISMYEKRPDKESISLEFQTAKDLIRLLTDIFGRVIFKVGNHEARWDKFLMRNPAIFGVDNFQLKTILGVKDFVDSKTPMKVGKLTLIHGHELTKGANSPVNFAKTLFNKLGESTMAGHLHQTSEHSFTRQPSGDIVTCWSIGTLGDLHPDYSPMPQWNNGFAFVEVESNGDFHVQNKRVRNGKIY